MPEIFIAVADTTEQKIEKVTAFIKLILEKTGNQPVDKEVELLTLTTKEERAMSMTMSDCWWIVPRLRAREHFLR